MRWPALPLLVLSASVLAGALSAQRRPHFHGSLGFAGGRYAFDSDQSGFDDDANAGLLQARFEATSSRGFGGGIRYEYLRTENDEGLFRDPGNAFDRGTEARSGTFQAHFTYRYQQHRFAMPVRIGVLVNGLVLDDEGATNPESTFVSVGPFFEVEPELTLLRSGPLRWSIYGLMGLSGAATGIDLDGDFRDYTSSSGFFMVEAGTRLRIGPGFVGLAFIGRYQSMDRSDLEGNNFIFGYDSEFEGILLSAGVSF